MDATNGAGSFFTRLSNLPRFALSKFAISFPFKFPDENAKILSACSRILAFSNGVNRRALSFVSTGQPFLPGRGNQS